MAQIKIEIKLSTLNYQHYKCILYSVSYPTRDLAKAVAEILIGQLSIFFFLGL